MPKPVASPFKEYKAVRRKNTQREAFFKELRRQFTLHGDDHDIAKIFRKCSKSNSHKTNVFNRWLNFDAVPRAPSSFKLLNKLEKQYCLPKNYFRNVLYPDTPSERAIATAKPCEQHHVRWHLPTDFDSCPVGKQREILAWIRTNVLSCGTEYGRYMSKSRRQPFTLRFPVLHDVPPQEQWIWQPHAGQAAFHRRSHTGTTAPLQLVKELTELVRFKRSTMSRAGMERTTAWSKSTAFIVTRRIGHVLGALAASPKSAAKGFGAKCSALTIALFVFPAFWDWVLQWREHRRGFFNQCDTGTLTDAMSLLRKGTGWVRQNPSLADHLISIPGLISNEAIEAARSDWSRACDNSFAHLHHRFIELRRVARIHRDPFFPVLSVLRCDAPLQEYRKIADAVLRCMPNENRHPVAAAEHVRAYLLIRLEMQLALRGRNLRELLVCQKMGQPKEDRELKKLRRGELRWSDTMKGWEVYIPSEAFKNWPSTFFRNTPFRVALADVADLYFWIDAYLRKYRPILLGRHSDPGTFFVRTAFSDRMPAEYDCSSLGSLWRTIVIMFGIYNPYTKRGAIKGLMPHYPHVMRDVIATHIIKQTHSFELAAYALHCTPTIIEKHYCRGLAEEKAAAAGPLLSEIWNHQPASRRKRSLSDAGLHNRRTF
jgi:hypothetical protein